MAHKMVCPSLLLQVYEYNTQKLQVDAAKSSTYSHDRSKLTQDKCIIKCATNSIQKYPTQGPLGIMVHCVVERYIPSS